MATPKEARIVRAKIGGAVKLYKEYRLGHVAFMIGKDMSYFKQDVVNFLQQYHPSLNHLNQEYEDIQEGLPLNFMND